MMQEEQPGDNTTDINEPTAKSSPVSRVADVTDNIESPSVSSPVNHVADVADSIESPTVSRPENSIADTAAWIVTVLFHPVFLPLYGLLLMFNIPSLLVFMPGNIRRVLFLMVLANNVIMPLALLPLFKIRGIISSYRIESRSERVIPLMSTSVMYFISAIMIFRFQLPGVVKSFMFAAACVVFISALINFRWRVSIHATGVGAMVATTLLLSFQMYSGIIWIVALAFLVSGLVMTSRLWLNAHSPREIYSGFFLGFVVMALGFLM
jgi:hypothetical protein